jgi:hypothetical protein
MQKNMIQTIFGGNKSLISGNTGAAKESLQNKFLRVPDNKNINMMNNTQGLNFHNQKRRILITQANTFGIESNGGGQASYFNSGPFSNKSSSIVGG